MENNIVKMRISSVEKLLEEAQKLDADSIVMCAFKGRSFQILISASESRAKTLGALDLIKHDLIHEE